MATTVITAATAATTSDPFVMSGEGKLICDPLVTGEWVKLQEELPNGTYKDAVDDNGVGVVLVPGQLSRIVVGYGNYKMVKSATASAVGVELES